MYCRKCGADIRLNAKFCAKCGTPVAIVPEAKPEAARPKVPVVPSEPPRETAVEIPRAPGIKPEEPAKLMINIPETKQNSSNGQFHEWFTEADDLN